MDRACRVQKMHIDPCCGLTFVKVGAEAWTKVENGDFLSKNSKWSLLLFKDIQLIKTYQKYSKVHNPLSPTKIEPCLFGCPSSKGQRCHSICESFWVWTPGGRVMKYQDIQWWMRLRHTYPRGGCIGTVQQLFCCISEWWCLRITAKYEDDSDS